MLLHNKIVVVITSVYLICKALGCAYYFPQKKINLILFITHADIPKELPMILTLRLICYSDVRMDIIVVGT